jgi:hypothetical protein
LESGCTLYSCPVDGQRPQFPARPTLFGHKQRFSDRTLKN